MMRSNTGICFCAAKVCLSLQFLYIVKETGNVNKENHQLRDALLMYSQSLRTDIDGNLWHSVKNEAIFQAKDKTIQLTPRSKNHGNSILFLSISVNKNKTSRSQRIRQSLKYLFR